MLLALKYNHPYNREKGNVFNNNKYINMEQEDIPFLTVERDDFTLPHLVPNYSFTKNMHSYRQTDVNFN